MTDPTHLQAQWTQLKQQLDSGQISPQQFQAATANLQATDAQGVSWSVDPSSGALLRWTGQQWAPAAAPGPPPSGAYAHPGGAAPGAPTMHSPTPQMPGGTPQTLFQLGATVVKGAIKGMGSAMVGRLKLAIILGAIVWTVHTILLIGPNGGFASDNAFLDHILALGGWKFFGGTVLWTVGVYVGTVLYSKSKHPGLGPFFSGLSAAPAWITRSIESAGGFGRPLLFAGATLGLAVGALTDSSFAGAILAFMLIMSMATGRQSLALFATRLGWSDIQRWRGSGALQRGFREDFGIAFLGGMTAGFLATVLVAPFPAWVAFIAVVAVGITAGSMLKGGGTPSYPTPGIWILFCGFLMHASELLADDGGWAEAGGGFVAWITSDGAILAIAVGGGPALGGALGFLVAASLADLAATLPMEPLVSPPEPEFEPEPEPEPEVQPQEPVKPEAPDRESRWIKREDGKVVPQIYDADTGQWREARHGDRDRHGQVLDMTAAGGGAFVDQASSDSFQHQREENERMRERERAKIEEHRRQVEEKMRRLEAEKAAREAKRAWLEKRQKKLELLARQAELEIAQEEAGLEVEAWDESISYLENVKWTADVAFSTAAGVSGGWVAPVLYNVATETAGGVSKGVYDSNDGVLWETGKGAVKGLFKAGADWLQGEAIKKACPAIEALFQKAGKPVVQNLISKFPKLDGVMDGVKRYFGATGGGYSGGAAEFMEQMTSGASQAARRFFKGGDGLEGGVRGLFGGVVGNNFTISPLSDWLFGKNV